MTEDDLMLHIRRLSEQYAYASIQMHESIGRKAGLSGTDHKYLGFLIQKGIMTAGEFATITGLTTGAVTGLIDRLAKKKLLKRKYAKDDRRKVLIVPNTKNIYALLLPLYQEFRKRSENLIQSFSASEMQVIAMYLHGAIEIMNQTHDEVKSSLKDE